MAMYSVLRFGVSPVTMIKILNNSSVNYLGNLIRTPTSRLSSYIPKSKIKTPGEIKFLKKDNIPAGFQLIYRAPMQYYVEAAHHLTNLSAFAAVTLALYVTVYGADELETPLKLEATLRTDKSDIKYYAGAFVLLCLGMRHIVMRYPHRIFRKDKECIAVLEGTIPFTKRQVNFRQGEVTQMEPKGFLPWKDSWYRVNNQKMILLMDYFKTPSELHNMLKPYEL